jgi:acyl dehydratase
MTWQPAADVAARRAARASLAGQHYRLDPVRVEPEHAHDYALATGDNPEYYAGQGIAPPLLAVRFVAPLWRAVYQDPRLQTGDRFVLHAEQRMLFADDLRLGERVTVDGGVTAVIGFGLGDAALIRSRLLDSAGRVVMSMECTLAIRGGSGLPPWRRAGAAPAIGAEVCTATRRFDDDAPARYADAADDHNPLHLDDAAAQAAGHPGRIVHGMCTLASGVAALSAARLGCPGARLRYVRARFTRPVRPGDEVIYRARATASPVTFAMGAAESGRAVLKSGLLRFSL